LWKYIFFLGFTFALHDSVSRQRTAELYER
jgi:hypothetical protein